MRLFMSLGLACTLALGAPAVAAAPARPTVTIDYRASEPANFVWLLNALAGGDPHSGTASFRAYWKQAGLERAGDDAALADFRRVRDRYVGEYLHDDEAAGMPIPVSPNGGDLRDKFFSLFFSSATMAEVWAKAEVLLTDADRATLQGAFGHFAPAFAAHWKGCGALRGASDRFARYARAQHLDGVLAEAAGFYGVPAGTAMPVRVIFLFTPDRRHTFGRAVGPNLVVEVPAGQGPEEQADVVVHELCHYFYDRGGLERDAAFVKGFFAGGDRRAGPAWGLLNEGLATALGEGVATERLAPSVFASTRARPEGWYDDERIDRYAKALFPAVKGAIAAGGTVRDLGPAMREAYGLALGDAARCPATYLGSYVLVDGFPRRQGFTRFFERIPPRSVWHARLGNAAGMLGDYPAATVVAALTTEQLAALDEAPAAWQLTPAERAALAAQPMALLAKPRAMNGYLFLVVGRDAAALDEAMARFGAMARFEEGLTAL